MANLRCSLFLPDEQPFEAFGFFEAGADGFLHWIDREEAHGVNLTLTPSTLGFSSCHD
jgi:hypothetical protein